MKTIPAILLISVAGLSAQAQSDASQNAAPVMQLAQVAPPSFPTPPTNRFRQQQHPFPGRGGVTNSAARPFSTNVPATSTSSLVSTNGGAGLDTNSGSMTLPGLNSGTNATDDTGEQYFPPGYIDFPEIKVDQFLEVYAQLVERTVLHAPLPAMSVSLKTQTRLSRRELVQAFKSVLAMNNITLVDVGDKFVKAVPVNMAQMQAKPFNSADANHLGEDDEYITQIVQLKYVKPKDMLPALQPLANIQNSILPIDDNNILIIRDYSSNVKRMMELIKQIDIMVPLDFESEVIPIKYAQAADIASALGSLGGGTGTSIGKGSTVGGGGTGAQRPGGFGSTSGGYGAGGLGSTPGTMGSGISQPGGFGSSNPAGGTRTSSFQDRLSSLVKSAAKAGEFQVLGQTKIIADQRTNSLLVFASKQDMEMIKNIIKKLDIVLAQVLIEAIIMEVNLDNSHQLGFSYLQNSPTTAGHGYFQGLSGLNNGTFLTPGSFATTVGTNVSAGIPSGFSYFANFGNDFQMTATAIANDSRINILSRPRIQTSHGVPASIQVGQSVPEVTGTYFGGINGAASSQYQQQFVGISLNVTPLINPDGLVVMDITGQVQQLGPNYTIDGNPVPSTTQRNAQATVSVRDRDTIILGGMISSSMNSTHAGVPVLKDIPVLGYLFRSTSVDKQRVELIILIRPTVLPTPEAAALVAAHERNSLPGVRQAEAEEQKDANQRLKDAEKIKVPEERQ